MTAKVSSLAMLDVVAGIDPRSQCSYPSLVVKYTEAHRHYLAALRANPRTPAPDYPTKTVAELHDWKAEMRAFDQVRMDLGLVTAAELRVKNAAIPMNQHQPRIVKNEEYV